MGDESARLRRDIADAILSHRTSNYRRWLDDEAGELAATRFDSLDEIPRVAILPLAEMCARGVSDVAGLSDACGIERAEVQQHLDVLCEFGFAEQTASGCKSTPFGHEAFFAVGETMIRREIFEAQGRLEELRRLHAKVVELSKAPRG